MPGLRCCRLTLPVLGFVLVCGARGAAAASVPPPVPAPLHARLEASVPAEDDTLRAPLDTMRLEFSARVTVGVTRLVLVLPTGDSIALEAASGSDDGTVVVAAAPRWTEGPHVLRWRTTSADGHVLEGAIPFVVAAGAVPATLDSVGAERAATPAPAAPAPPPADFGAVLPLLRALGTGLLLALSGGLLFASRSRTAAEALRPLLTAFALAAPFAIIAELLTWTVHVAGRVDLAAALQLATGQALFARLVLAAVALAVWVLTRSARAAAFVAFIAVLASGGLGHAVTESPGIGVPLRALHMAAAAVWLGGLLALTRSLRAAPPDMELVHAVSTAALWSFLGIALTGAAQTLLLLGSPGALIGTGYGRVVLVKVAGLIALAAFGYRHRQLIAGMTAGQDGSALRMSVRAETLLFIGLIVVAAALSFTPLPE